MTTVAGTAPVLPATGTATMSNGTTQTVAITWDAVDASKYAAAGTFTVSGTIAGSTVKATATVTVTPAQSDLAVNAVNKTTVTVTFNAAVDAVAASNFTLSKGTVESATLSADKKTATLNVKGLAYSDVISVTIDGVLANGVAIPKQTVSNVKVPAITDLYNLEIISDAANDTILSDNASKTMLTVTLKDKKTGNAVNVDGIVKFQATLGGLAQDEVALQGGKASVQLTSSSSTVSVVSTITATIINAPAATDYVGLSNQKDITFSPDATNTGTQTFVTEVAASASQADRFNVTFSDKITAAAYIAALPLTEIANKHYGLNINGSTVEIKDVKQATDYSLTFILDTDTLGSVLPSSNRITDVNLAFAGTVAPNYLQDNATFNVSFPVNIGNLVLANTTGRNFTLTDNARPFIYGVTPVDQLNFTVRTSEALAEDLVEGADGTAVNQHFLLDGKQVILYTAPTDTQIASAKAANQIIVSQLSVGSYDALNDVDTRNVVTFKLNPSFKLAAGAHQIQIANIGDWAAITDPNNLVSTQTFDFTVNADTTKPVASIVVESPEQWKVHIDKAVYSLSGKKVEDTFKIFTKDDAVTPLTYGTDYVVTPVDANGNTIATSSGTGLNKEYLLGNTISLTDGQDFLIEFKQDWTQKYTTSTSAINYFTSTKNPYTVTVANLQTELNNVMDSQNLNVSLIYDGKSPEIPNGNAVDVSTLTGMTAQGYTVTAAGQAVLVKMSEPVQLRNAGDTVDSVYLTPSEQQLAGAGIPIPTFEFVQGDKTVEGKIQGGTINKEDNTFVITPASTLASGTWTLYVRSISDDVGNTSATVNTTVTVPGAAVTTAPTKVEWAAFDNGGSTAYDDLYVKFTKVMDPSNANGVSRTTNYTFNGVQLPQGSSILQGIKGVTNKWDGVTIQMPKGAFDGNTTGTDFTSVLNVASNFKDTDGNVLVGPYQVQLADTANDAASVADQDMILQAQWNSATLNVGGAAALTAAAADTDNNGTIDQVTLNFDQPAPALVPAAAYTIKVNGKTFATATGANGPSLIFNAIDASNQIASTDTTNLVVTGTDGSILINAGSVPDTVLPVALLGAVNTASFKVVSATQITVVFSEALNATTFTANNANGFTVTGGTVNSAALNADGKTVTLTGSAFAVGATVAYAPGTIASVTGNALAGITGITH